MTLGRRAFLTRLGIGAIAAPAAAKHAVDTMTAQLAGVETSPLPAGPYGASGQGNPLPPSQEFPRNVALKRLMQLPGLRDEYTSAMFEQYRSVSVLDLDLASKRSFSLAAKVTFQRQRNVERGLQHEMLGHWETPWGRSYAMLRKAMGFTL